MTFIVGSSNRMAHAVAQSVAERPGTAYNPLFIYGGSGLGKTHLLQAIGQVVQATGKRALYVTSEVFTNEMIGAIRTQTTEEFRAKYRTIDVLLLDDVHFIGGKEQTQEEFFHTFNALHTANRQIVLTSDRPPQAIATLEDRLRSRFGWGMIADIQPPNLETRIAILMTKAASLGQRVPDDVLALIAQRAHKNIRDLEGALTKVLAHAELFKRPLNAALVEDALAYLMPAQTKLSPEMIMQNRGRLLRHRRGGSGQPRPQRAHCPAAPDRDVLDPRGDRHVFSPDRPSAGGPGSHHRDAWHRQNRG